ncbi:uncharacterized protein RAG0_10224 [Rhynchosporium agropyri]|uniref:Major facilitator superfamily (MFS) profile domain-containing protein n=1 Tax=Rhynchosporium agropyri TaxID=914238 RepID=A0A1E1KZ07_9HELO|nr:uncharacterized protein RAG0_10224 [Rhynchosporium agropyri]
MAAIDYTSTPWGLQWRSKTVFILGTVAIGMFTDLFLYGLVVPILPFILVDRIQVPDDQIQYYTSLLLACYAGSQVISSLPAGLIADKLPSRQPPFLVGLAALFCSTAMLFTGRTIWVLVVARLLQGLSASIVWTVGLAMVMDTVGSDKLGITIGSMFSFITVGELIAPVFGGFVYKKAGSGAVFGTAFGLLVIDFVMRLLVIEKKVAEKYGVDYSESSDDDSEFGETSPLLTNGKTKEEELAKWVIPAGQPTWVKKFPILYCMGNSRFIVALVVAFMQATTLAVFDATIVIESRDLFGFDSLKAGLLFIPLILPPLVIGPIAGRGVDKYGARVFAALGFLYLCIPLVLLRIPHIGGTAEIAKMATILGFCGLGLAIISSPSIVEASHVVEQYHRANKDLFGENGPYGQLYAVSSMVFSAGLTCGPLISGALRERVGYGNMNAIMGAFCVIVSALSWVYLGRIPKMVKKGSSGCSTPRRSGCSTPREGV